MTLSRMTDLTIWQDPADPEPSPLRFKSSAKPPRERGAGTVLSRGPMRVSTKIETLAANALVKTNSASPTRVVKRGTAISE